MAAIAPSPNVASMEDLYAGAAAAQATGSVRSGVPKQTPALAQSLVNRFRIKHQTVLKELGGFFVERDDEILLAHVAMIARINMVIYGPKGTGKTEMVEAIVSHIDPNDPVLKKKSRPVFKHQGHPTADVSEIIGSLSIKGLQNDRMYRVTEGMLPDAIVGVEEEIFKLSHITAQGLLDVTNGFMINDGKRAELDLLSIFANSNEDPEDDDLWGPFRDRLHIRVWVDYVKSDTNRLRMMQNYLTAMETGLGYVPKTFYLFEEMKAMGEHCRRNVKVPMEVQKILIQIRNDFKADAIEINSDRRFLQQMLLLKVMAGLQGREKVGFGDLKWLEYFSWERKSEIKKVNTIIGKYRDPYETLLKDSFTKLETKQRELADLHSKGQLAQFIAQSLDAHQKLGAQTLIEMKEKLDESQTSGLMTSKHTGLYQKAEKLVDLFKQYALNQAKP